MSLHKAKTLTGEWVKGDLFNATSGMTIIENGGSDPKNFHFINPSTLCQQVRGTEFFEGDEVRFEVAFDLKRHKMIGHIVWNDQLKGYMIQNANSSDRYQFCEPYSIEPTGKNKHNDE
jgi:hypothetical protein